MGFLVFVAFVVLLISVGWLIIGSVNARMREFRSELLEVRINLEKYHKELRELRAAYLNIINGTDDRSFKTGKRKSK